MSDISNYYLNGSPKWNPKFNPPSNSIPIIPIISEINALYNLSCSDIILYTDVQEMIIGVTAGSVIFKIEEIVSLDISTLTIIIKSGDKNPFSLNFIDNNQLLSFSTRLNAVMNGGNDPGC